MSELVKKAADVLIEKIEKMVLIAAEQAKKQSEKNPFRAGLVNEISISWEQYEPSLLNNPEQANTLYINFSGRHVHVRSCQIDEKMELDLLSLTKEDIEEGLLPLLQKWVEPKVQGQEYGGVFDADLTISPTIKLQKDASGAIWSQKDITVIDSQRKEMQHKKIYNFIADKEYEKTEISGYSNSYNEVLRIASNMYFDEFGSEKLNEFFNTLMAQAKELDTGLVSKRIAYGWLMDAFVFAAEGLIGFKIPTFIDKGTLTTAEVTPEKIELGVDLLFLVLLNSKEESSKNDARKLLTYAAKMKNARAKGIVTFGTGQIPNDIAEYKDENVACLVNDIDKCVTFKLKNENEEAYRAMLEYLSRLLETSFPKKYKIKINTKLKTFLPVAGLHKSPTHKFWVNCASYPNLHAEVEKYIRGMIENYDHYFDGGEDDENPMSTGGYAMLALALNYAEYGGLLKEYLDKNKRYDHNILSDAAIELYINKWGITEQTFDTVFECINWYDRLNSKKTDFSGFKSAEILKMVNAQSDEKDYMFERIVDYVWGSKNGLKKAIQSESGDKKEEMQKLLCKIEA